MHYGSYNTNASTIEPFDRATGFSTDKETLTNDGNSLDSQFSSFGIPSFNKTVKSLSLQHGTSVVRESDVENGSGSAEKARAGTAGFLIELENRRSIKVGNFD